MTLPNPLPDLPYFAVIFVSLRAGADPAYDRMAEEMHLLALAHPGCLGSDSARAAETLRHHIGVSLPKVIGRVAELRDAHRPEMPAYATPLVRQEVP